MDKRYLLQRKRCWYVRYAIPPKVQQHFGKSEFVVSLKTRSLEEAKIRKLYYLQSFSREIQSVLNLGYLNSKETDFEKIKSSYFIIISIRYISSVIFKFFY